MTNSNKKINVRPLTPFEKWIILNILDSGKPEDLYYVNQIPHLMADPDPETGSLWLTSVSSDGNYYERTVDGGMFSVTGMYRGDDAIVQFMLFSDEQKRLSELYVVNYCFTPYPQKYDLDKITFSTEAH